MAHYVGPSLKSLPSELKNNKKRTTTTKKPLFFTPFWFPNDKYVEKITKLLSCHIHLTWCERDTVYYTLEKAIRFSILNDNDPL